MLQGIERPKEPGLRSLRTARELKEDMVSNCALHFINVKSYSSELPWSLLGRCVSFRSEGNDVVLRRLVDVPYPPLSLTHFSYINRRTVIEFICASTWLTSK